jgi:hypothetical protein
MKNILLFYMLALGFCSMHGSMKAQKLDSLGLVHTGKVAFTEKVYLHLDRHYYTSHEDIWFKAYLVNATNNKPSANSSKTLYAELISPDSKLVAREVLRMDSAVAMGEFKLGDSIPSGKYRIRAYTKWMLNFGDAFIFEKEIEVQAVSKKTTPGIVSKKADNIDIRFFPEGGTLVADVMGFVAFKATDVTGKSCDVKGMVVSSHGDTVAIFEGMHLGMGKFALNPRKNETYHAVGTAKNLPFRADLPPVSNTGFALWATSADTMFAVTINTNDTTWAQDKDKSVVLEYTHAGSQVMKQTIPLIAKSRRIMVSKLFFPAGITRITLYDPQHRPQCDRLVYVDTKQKIHLSVQTDRQNYKPHEKVLVKIKATDNHGNPVKTNLSFSATDGEIVPPALFNIESYLMLESELHGKIEQPLMYFDTTNKMRNRQLDLLLLTQGWSSYIWRHVADSISKTRYFAEQGLAATGYVRRKLINTPVKDANVAFIIQDGRGMVRSGKTDKDGKFDLGEVKFYGLKTILLSAFNNTHESVGWVFLDSMYVRAMHVPIKPVTYTQIDTAATLLKFAAGAASKEKVLRKYRLSDTIVLNEVKIGTAKHPSAKLEKDLAVQSADSVYRDLEWYLGVKYPYTRSPNLRIKYTIVGLPGTLFETEVSNLKSMSMKDIRKVEIYKGWSAMELDSARLRSGDMTTDDYTKPDWKDLIYIDIFIKPYALNKRNFSTASAEVSGYYRNRMFYSPIPGYSDFGAAAHPDLRTTIHWAPNFVTDKNGEATLFFYNADQTGKVRTNVEGISDKGQPVVASGSYTVDANAKPSGF